MFTEFRGRGERHALRRSGHRLYEVVAGHKIAGELRQLVKKVGAGNGYYCGLDIPIYTILYKFLHVQQVPMRSPLQFILPNALLWLLQWGQSTPSGELLVTGTATVSMTVISPDLVFRLNLE